VPALLKEKLTVLAGDMKQSPSVSCSLLESIQNGRLYLGYLVVCWCKSGGYEPNAIPGSHWCRSVVRHTYVRAGFLKVLPLPCRPFVFLLIASPSRVNSLLGFRKLYHETFVTTVELGYNVMKGTEYFVSL
jgi:hypothetical protein